MQRVKTIILVLLISFVTLFSNSNNSTTKIFVNQVGYIPQFVKYAVVTGKADSFKLYSLDDNKIVLTKKLSKAQYWAPSNENVRIADFTEISREGRYKIAVDSIQSYEFKITNDIFTDISHSAMRTFYYQRASTELPEKYAGKWARKCGLPDTSVIVHLSAASEQRPAGTIISAPKGWFDAGDYNKYIVNSGITVYTLLLLYDLFPDYFNSISLNIPESNNNIPDILDEILWNVRWMLKMQDPSDGGVYHKLTCKQFQPYIMPAEVTAERFVVGKSTVAALNFAAVLSHLAVVIKENNLPLDALRDSCLIAAKSAWDWAIQNPDKHFKNPEDVVTGEYSDNNLTDNFFWTGIELYRATKDSSYLHNLDKLNEMVVDSLYWAKVANLGILTVMNENIEFQKSVPNISVIRSTFSKSVEKIYNNNINSPYKISLGIFKWGSNANLLNETLMLLVAHKIYGDEKYLKAAITNTDYILGRNPLSICYVTGNGSKSPQNIHHRISVADGIKEPIPGFVVGGPNPYYLIDCGKEKYPSLLPAKCYLDDVDSYSTNEVAINWNAPLAFVLFTLDHYSKN